MKVDDDNFITRYMVKHGYKTVFWNQPEAMMTTTLGVSGIVKFKGQLLRWARTTIRSNCVSMLQDKVCWTAHPWTSIAMFASAYFNIALIYDATLFLTLYKATETGYLGWLALALALSKLVKPLGHLIREPGDVGFWVLGVLFGCLHSFVKIYAIWTADNSKTPPLLLIGDIAKQIIVEWCGRTGIAAEGELEKDEKGQFKDKED